jgi:hypothetical protein
LRVSRWLPVRFLRCARRESTPSWRCVTNNSWFRDDQQAMKEAPSISVAASAERSKPKY